MHAVKLRTIDEVLEQGAWKPKEHGAKEEKRMNENLAPLTTIWPESLRGMEDNRFPGWVELIFTVDSGATETVIWG